MSLTTQQIIDAVGGGLFSVALVGFGGLALVNTFMDRCPQNKMASVRIKLLSHAATIALIQAFAYWAAFGGYGAFTRPGDGLVIQGGLLLAWPFSWFFVGKALGTYLWHNWFWKKVAARSLALAGLSHYLGAYIDTTTPGTQWAAYILGSVATLTAVYVAIVLRRRRDTNATITLVVGVIGLAVGFCLSFILSEAILNIVGGTGYSIWLLAAKFVVYIVYFAWLLLTGRDQPLKRGD